MVLELRLESPIWIDVLWLAVIYWHTNILSGFAASFSSGFVSQSIHIHIGFYLWLVLRLPIHWRPTSKFGPFFFCFSFHFNLVLPNTLIAFDNFSPYRLLLLIVWMPCYPSITCFYSHSSQLLSTRSVHFFVDCFFSSSCACMKLDELYNLTRLTN